MGLPTPRLSVRQRRGIVPIEVRADQRPYASHVGIALRGIGWEEEVEGVISSVGASDSEFGGEWK